MNALAIIQPQAPVQSNVPCEWSTDTVARAIWAYLARWPGKLKNCPTGQEAIAGDLGMDAANYVHWLAENLGVTNDKRGELQDLAAALAVQARRLLEIGWGHPTRRDEIGAQLAKLNKRMDEISELANRCLNVGDMIPLSEVPPLTLKQRQVLQGLARGLTHAEIAVAMRNSREAVGAICQTLRAKLGCPSVEHIRLWAQDHGFRDGPPA